MKRIKDCFCSCCANLYSACTSIDLSPFSSSPSEKKVPSSLATDAGSLSGAFDVESMDDRIQAIKQQPLLAEVGIIEQREDVREKQVEYKP